MGYYPPEIRSFLRLAQFQQAPSGDWSLTLPPFYARLFEELEEDLYRHCIGWRQSYNSFMQYTYFKGIGDSEVDDIRTFLNDFGFNMLIGKSGWIASHFGDELDVCIALDKNYKSLTERTEIGELEYQAKWGESEEALDGLVHYLLEAMECANRFCITEQSYISYIPFNVGKPFDLPSELARRIADRLGVEFFGVSEPLVQPALKRPKPSMKDTTLEQKFAFWKKIVDTRGIDLSQQVTGKTVYIVDDLYQSGVTIWSYAQFLKLMGADRVIGVVCVKAGKDTDNTSGDFG
ncbi:MAG: phosphoribosyltransferase [Chloroflexi bacterium]|nr:phosphoribosyltransferase [Chloroflexota bacterium]